MKNGDIILVHSESKIAKIIQKFQMKNDPKAGYWNHSGLIYVAKSGTYVVEMAEIEGYKFKASTVFTPINEYLESDRELLLLSVRAKPQDLFEEIMFKYIGIPYDYKNLLIHQVIRLLTGKWRGRSKSKAWKRMVCHEFTQKIWDEYLGIFPEWNKASIAEIYNSTYFKHYEIKG